jgi:two-component sensor histidine kinase/CHASE3 domain sensor protein
VVAFGGVTRSVVQVLASWAQAAPLALPVIVFWTASVPNTDPNDASPKAGHHKWPERFSPLVFLIAWTGVTAIISVLFFKAMDESRMRVRGTHDVLLAAKDFMAAANDAETGQRGYLITLKDSYLSPYRKGLATAGMHLSALEVMQSHNPEQLARLKELRGLWIEKAEELASTVELAQESEIEAARAKISSDRDKNLMDTIRRIVSDIEAAETVTRSAAIGEQSLLDKLLFAFTQLTTLAGFMALIYLLSQARRAASELEKEVSNRQSAEELGRERAEQALRMRVMNRELVHRTKNLISVVQAIVRNQGSGSPEIEGYVAGLSSRLVSLAATMDILVRENWGQVALADLIAGQLGHFSEDVGRRITVKPGPTIKFNASESQMLGLAFHELGTNAAKYGALSVPDGQIDIHWTEQLSSEGSMIALHWLEKGGPPANPRTKKGFGSRLTGSLVARAVSGEANVEYLPQGLAWTLTLPRDRREPSIDDAIVNGSNVSNEQPYNEAPIAKSAAGQTAPIRQLDSTENQ